MAEDAEGDLLAFVGHDGDAGAALQDDDHAGGRVAFAQDGGAAGVGLRGGAGGDGFELGGREGAEERDLEQDFALVGGFMEAGGFITGLRLRVGADLIGVGCLKTGQRG